MTLQKKYDILTICNALVDILYHAKEEDLRHFNMAKGCMSLVDAQQQKEILNYLGGREAAIELGGSSLNVIRTLAMLHKKTVFAGMLSVDRYGREIHKRLAELQIKSHLRDTDQDATGTCVILVTEDGERTMNTHLGASRLYDIDIVPEQDIKQSRIFHFSGYQWDSEQQKQAILKALHVAKEAGCLISFDLADPFVVKHNKKDFSRVINEFANIVFANEEESRLLFDLSPEETARKIAAAGKTAVVKLGARGAVIGTESALIPVAVVPTTVVDTTGAGDMFAAGFLYGWLSQLRLEDCGKLASLLASDVISRYGAKLSPKVIQLVLQDYGGVE